MVGGGRVPAVNDPRGPEDKDSVALCVCKHLDTVCAHRHPPTPQELDLQSGSQVNGLFVKRRPAVSNRKHSAPAISPQGE